MPSIDVPIIDLLFNPTLPNMGQTDEGVHGPGPLDINIPVPNSLGAVAYGCRIDAITVPAAWGRKLGNPNRFIPAIATMGITATLADTNVVTTQLTDVLYDGQLMLWQQSGLQELLVHVEPGVTIHIRWLTVFL